LGMLLGKVEYDGHSREQHLSWAISDIQSLRSTSAFGRELTWLSHNPLTNGSMH
jgi:hypothetical protein